MENKKQEDIKKEISEKFAWFDYHRILAPLVVVFLFIGVFAIGIFVGHEFGDRGGRGENNGWGNGDKENKGFFYGNKRSEGINGTQDAADGEDTEIKSGAELKIKDNGEIENSVSAEQNFDATTTATTTENK